MAEGRRRRRRVHSWVSMLGVSVVRVRAGVDLSKNVYISFAGWMRSSIQSSVMVAVMVVQAPHHHGIPGFASAIRTIDQRRPW